MDKSLTIDELKKAKDKKIIVKFHKDMFERFTAESFKSFKQSLRVEDIDNVGSFFRIKVTNFAGMYKLLPVTDNGLFYGLDIPVFMYAEESLKAQNNIFCVCNNRKCKRVLISNSLQYDFCDNCKKEIKGELTNA
jgi:hypothetical protein